MNSVSESIAQTLVFHYSAISVWEDVKECFAKIDRIRIASLRSTINNLKQGSKSVLEYFTEMKSLWDELDSHRLIPNCTCIHPCRCESIRLAKQYRIGEQIIQFLTGLNEQFSVLKTQVLLMDPLPSLNRVYSLVVQEESNNSVLSSPVSLDESSILVNASDSRKPYGRGKSSSNGKNSTRFCTFCNRYNHTVEYCFKSMAILILISQILLRMLLMVQCLKLLQHLVILMWCLLLQVPVFHKRSMVSFYACFNKHIYLLLHLVCCTSNLLDSYTV